MVWSTTANHRRIRRQFKVRRPITVVFADSLKYDVQSPSYSKTRKLPASIKKTPDPMESGAHSIIYLLYLFSLNGSPSSSRNVLPSYAVS